MRNAHFPPDPCSRAEQDSGEGPRPEGRHIIAGVAWVIGSMVAWSGVCNVYAFSMMYLQNDRGVNLPLFLLGDVYNWGALGGAVLIPALVAVLSMRGKLLGTGRRTHGRGFPVEVVPPNGGANGSPSPK